MAFKLSSDQLSKQWKVQGGRCAYSGLPMSLMVDKKDPLRASIDRVDSRRGYEQGNIVFCCHALNCCKSDMSMAEFRRLIDTTARYLKKASPLASLQ